MNRIKHYTADETALLSEFTEACTWLSDTFTNTAIKRAMTYLIILLLQVFQIIVLVRLHQQPQSNAPLGLVESTFGHLDFFTFKVF